MKVAILAGGLGTRLQEETIIRPKPMVEVGGMPILWHIMKIYSKFGYNEFFLALGYKAEMIKDYFINYSYLESDITVNLKSGSIEVKQPCREDWIIHLVNTGVQTQTGGRIKRIGKLIGNEPFMLTYGDGVANIDVERLLEFHQQQGKLVTMTAVRPPARFGNIEFNGNQIAKFAEKPQMGEGWIQVLHAAREPQGLHAQGEQVRGDHEQAQGEADGGGQGE